MTTCVADTCKELQSLQRLRVTVMRSQLMLNNRLRATVATAALGYHAGLEAADRKKLFSEAAALIKSVSEGEEHRLSEFILSALSGAGAFEKYRKQIEKSMTGLAKKLPAAEWSQLPEQRGFGLLSLATVAGEAGDLAGYANPAKLWRRMGCAPWTFGGKTLMGSTWRYGKEGTLPSLEWDKYRYSPRRRSISYLVGECLIKQNGDGPYRARYDAKKAQLQELHPDYSAKRCHLHGMLLASKLLLRNLWVAWSPDRKLTVWIPEAETEAA